MNKPVNLQFHQTFKPEPEHISSLLMAADDIESISLDQISIITGIPTGKSSGKVVPHLEYAQYMNLLTYNLKNGLYTVKLTDLGEVIREQDPSLVEELTLLMCHCMITRSEKGAPLWHDIVNHFLPINNYTINKSVLIAELNNYYKKAKGGAAYRPFFISYQEFFECLGIIIDVDDTIIMNKHAYDYSFLYLYAYVLFELWDERYPSQDEITSKELEHLEFHKPFRWTSLEVYEVLEHLSDKDIIRLNRQLTPFTILRLASKEEILSVLYDELM